MIISYQNNTVPTHERIGNNSQDQMGQNEYPVMWNQAQFLPDLAEYQQLPSGSCTAADIVQ